MKLWSVSGEPSAESRMDLQEELMKVRRKLPGNCNVIARWQSDEEMGTVAKGGPKERLVDGLYPGPQGSRGGRAQSRWKLQGVRLGGRKTRLARGQAARRWS